MGLAQRGNRANGDPPSAAARVGNGLSLDALVFRAGSCARCGTVYVWGTLHRGLARRLFLFADAVCGILLVSFVFHAAKSLACFACVIGRAGVCCVVCFAMAGSLGLGGCSYVVARTLAALHVDLTADLCI